MPKIGRDVVPSPARLALTRRRFFATALPFLASRSGWAQTLSARVAALGGPGLLQSYDVSGDSDFDRTQAGCAYVYDNAVVGLALLATGDDVGAAMLGEGLIAAQARDRFWHDGRLRNAYRAGRAPATGPYPLPGWWDRAQQRWLEDGYQVGTATGVVAWAMLLWLRLADGPGGARFRAAAERAADWVEAHMRAPHGYQGGFVGFEPSPQRLTWVSTEHNIDLAAAFAGLGRHQAAAHAASFVASMWQAAPGRFAMGLRPDGTLNDQSAVDANLWPLLTGFSHPAWARALPYVVSHHGLPIGAAPAALRGVDFNTDRDGIWLEGTAITALTCALLGEGAIAARLMATLRAQTAPGGLIYACTTPSLTTGLSIGLDARAADFLYYRRPHIAPTGWAVLARLGVSPFPK